MSEKQREQLDKNAANEGVPVAPNSGEVLADQDRSSEKEKQDKDMENLSRVASERAKSITESLVSKYNLKFLPSEQLKQEKAIESKLKNILESSYKNGTPETVEVQLNALVDQMLVGSERTAKNREKLAEGPKIQAEVKKLKPRVDYLYEKSGISDEDKAEYLKVMNQLKSETRDNLISPDVKKDLISSAEKFQKEIKSNLSEEEWLELVKSGGELNRLQSIQEDQTRFAENRWNNLTQEDRDSVQVEVQGTIKDIENSKTLSDDERKQALADLHKDVIAVWGVEMGRKIHENARNKHQLEKNPPTEDKEIVDELEAEDPVRHGAMRRFWNKAKLSYATSSNPVEIMAKMVGRSTKNGEMVEDDERTRKKMRTIRNIGGVAVAGILAYGAYRGVSSMDIDMGSLDLGDMFGADNFDSTPDLEVDGGDSPDTDGFMEDMDSDDADLDANGHETGDDEPIDGWRNHNYNDHGYDLANSPFMEEGKLGEFNFGIPIEMGEGFDAEVLDRADSEPAIHANYIQIFGLEGSSDSADSIQQRLLNDSEYFNSTLDQIREYMGESETTVRTLESGTYGSAYGYESEGRVVLAYDHVVNEAATVKEYVFTDVDGIERTVLIKAECGGQGIVEHQVSTSPAPVYEQSNAPVQETQYQQPVYTPTEQEGIFAPAQQETPVEDPSPVPETTPEYEAPPAKPEGSGPPPVEEKPPIEEGPPVEEAPPAEEAPPVEETPPPVETTPPAETPPPIETSPPEFIPEPKSTNPEDYMVPDGILLAEVNEPATPPAAIETGQDIFEETVEITAPEATVGTETQDRVEVIDSGASTEEVAELDLNTAHEAAVEQSTDANTNLGPGNVGTEVELY